MTALSIFLISLIQGITEFLPISSSGHLILLPVLTGLADQGQTADVAAHFGTLAAVILYLRRDLIRMASSVMPLTKTDRASLRLFGILILSSLPVILVGLGVEILSPSFLRLTITVLWPTSSLPAGYIGQTGNLLATGFAKMERIMNGQS